MRRDHAKYLGLIAAIALLHQYQRQARRDARGNRYLQATLDDVRQANRLASDALGKSLDELLPQTRQVLILWDDCVRQRSRAEKKPRADIRLTQRELREMLGWGDYQLRRHLSRLVELEYVLVDRTGRGNERNYQLLNAGEGREGERFILGLIDASTLVECTYDNRSDRPKGRNDAHPMPLRSTFDAPSITSRIDATGNDDNTLRPGTAKPSKNGQEPPQNFA